MEIEIILLKRELDKIIWRIKLAYQNEDGSYNIPEKYKDTIAVLTNSILTLTTLFEMVKNIDHKLAKERVNNVSQKREITNLKNTITEMTKQVRL